MKKYPRNDKIGLEVGDTHTISFSFMGKDYTFEVRSQSEANIAKSCIMYYREMWEQHNLSKSDILLDIGAHVGFSSLPLSSIVSHVYAYEPSPANHALLVRNIQANYITNITPVHKAISSTSGVERFNLGVYGTTGHYLASVGKKVGGVYTMVDTQSLDEIIDKYNINVIKMDAEGVEWELFRECSNWSKIRLMVAELHKVDRHGFHNAESFLSKYSFQYTVKHSSWFSKLIAWR